MSLLFQAIYFWDKNLQEVELKSFHQEKNLDWKK